MTATLPLADRAFQAVLFDLDGTLIDSTEMVADCWARWAREFGVVDFGRWVQHGVPAAAAVRAMQVDGALPASVLDEALARIEAIEVAAGWEGHVPLLPGTTDALRALPADRVAIVTSCSGPLAAARLAAAGLAVASILVTADQLERGKPAPDGYLRAAELLGADPSACLVVEDAPAGLRAGRAAGCALLALTTTTPAVELESELSGTDALVATLADVEFSADPDGIRVRRR